MAINIPAHPGDPSFGPNFAAEVLAEREWIKASFAYLEGLDATDFFSVQTVTYAPLESGVTLRKGDWGLGQPLLTRGDTPFSTYAEGTGFTHNGSGSNVPGDAPTGGRLHWGFFCNSTDQRGGQFLMQEQTRAFFRVKINSATYGAWAELWTSANTTVDGSGNIMQASPVVHLYSDRAEDGCAPKPVGATSERRGIGHYVLSGPEPDGPGEPRSSLPPLATREWTTRAPEGMTIETEWDDGRLHVFLDDGHGPADIPPGAYALLRFWEPDRIVIDGVVEEDVPPSGSRAQTRTIGEWEEGRWRRIVDAERDRRLARGVTVQVAGVGAIPVQGRDRDMSVVLGLRVAARDLIDDGVTAAVIPFRDGDNTDHMLTPAQTVEMTRRAQAGAQAIYQAAWALKALSVRPDDVSTWTGWP